MKLSKKAIKEIKNRHLMLKVALALNFSEQWMLILIKRNGENGPLTTVTAVQIIQNETGLSQEDILEGDAISVATAKVIGENH